MDRFRWIDATNTGAGPIVQAQVRVQHFTVLLHVVVGPLYLLLFGALGLHFAACVVALTITGAVVGLFAYTRRGKPYLGGIIVSAGFFCTITVSLVARGGMTSNSAAWLLLAPVLAFMLVGPRHGVHIAGATAAVFAGLWGLEQAGFSFYAGLPPELANIMVVVDYPIVASVIGGLLWAQAGVWEHVIADLDEGNKKLRDEMVERERAETAAIDAAQARYTFLATISHEIRTPLNGVLGLTEILLDTELDQDQLQLASTVRASGQLLRALLDDVLDFSKIDSGRLEVEEVPVNLHELCYDIVDLWRGPAGERNLKLEFLPEPDAPKWIVGDPTKLKQVLGNLVSNAIKFTDEGYVRIVLEGGEQLVVQVQDSGIGLDPTAAERIFEPFRQADSTTTRRHGGTGLGLAICRRLAEAMQGTLTLESAPSEGSTFIMTLPLVETEPVPDPSIEIQIATQPNLLSGFRVLVAEDNPVNQVLVRRLLERRGVEVAIAADGEQCVKMWQEQQPDLILMDCQMPVCDGYDASRRIRHENGELPIIAVTANTMPGDRERSLDAGMDDHLGKPIRPAELEGMLGRWLIKRNSASVAKV